MSEECETISPQELGKIPAFSRLAPPLPKRPLASDSARAAAAGQSKLRSNDSHAIANRLSLFVAEDRHANPKSPKMGEQARFAHTPSTEQLGCISRDKLMK